MMVWITVSVLGVLLSVVGVLFMVAPGVRQFCWGAVCGLGVAGGLLFLWQPSTTLEPTRESHAGARVSTQARETGTEPAVSWVPRPSCNGLKLKWVRTAINGSLGPDYLHLSIPSGQDSVQLRLLLSSWECNQRRWDHIKCD
jgi:hypothetical protein